MIYKTPVDEQFDIAVLTCPLNSGKYIHISPKPVAQGYYYVTLQQKKKQQQKRHIVTKTIKRHTPPPTPFVHML